MEENIIQIKKSVKCDWVKAFPNLSEFTQNKFYKISGCLIMGIEAVNIPSIKGYKPHFVIYPLWKESIRLCLDVPSIYICLNDKKGGQFSIPYLKHFDLHSEAIECFKQQFPILSNRDVNLQSLLDFIDYYLRDMLIMSNSAQQAKLFELKLYTALYVGNQVQVQNVLNQIQKSSRSWNMRLFETWYGDFDVWFQGLRDVIIHKDAFLKLIEKNKLDKKISKLKNSELTA